MTILSDTTRAREQKIYGRLKEILKRKPTTEKPWKIIFVDAGRYHRSPSMEIATVYFLSGLGITDIQVISRGFLDIEKVLKILNIKDGQVNKNLVEAVRSLGMHTDGMAPKEGDFEEMQGADLIIVANMGYKEELLKKYGGLVESKILALGEFFMDLPPRQKQEVKDNLKNQIPKEEFDAIDFDNLVGRIPDPDADKISNLTMFLLIKEIIERGFMPLVLSRYEELKEITLNLHRQTRENI